MEIAEGNYKDIEASELRALTKGIFKKYHLDGGQYSEAEFTSYSNSPAYDDLQNYMYRGILESLEKLGDDLEVRHSQLYGDEKNRKKVTSFLLPSVKVMVKIIHNSKSIKKASFRRTAVDACYLYAFHATRSESLASLYEDQRSYEEGVLFGFTNLLEEQELSSIMETGLDVNLLHFVGIYNPHNLLCYGHILRSKEMAKWLLGTSPDEKLEQLRALGRDVSRLIGKLNEPLGNSGLGHSQHLTLTPESGLVHCYRINHHISMVTVCLNRSSSLQRQNATQDLATSIGEYFS